MIVKKDSFIHFLRECVDNNIYGIEEVIAPSKNQYSSNGETYFCEIGTCMDVELDMQRTVDPLKILFYLSRESTSPNYHLKKRIIAGVKNCDLQALEITDQALMGDNFIDPSYKLLRDNTIIVSSDCDEIGSFCHCSLFGGKPYALRGFDLNLAGVDDEYLITVGSDKGEKLIESLMEFIPFEGTNNEAESSVAKKREGLEKKLIFQNEKYKISDISENLRNVPEPPWLDESYNCIGCGACTGICPTCYCLILNDESENGSFKKVKSYDSCQFNGYAKVAGGGTPRPNMVQRFRNRYLCKLDFMKSNFGKFGCIGCGRCSEACSAQIDFMEVVANNSKIAESL